MANAFFRHILSFAGLSRLFLCEGVCVLGATCAQIA